MTERLLIVCPTVMHGDALAILENAIAFVESYAGKWRQIEIVTARGTLFDMAEHYKSDAVLLLGRQMAGLLPAPKGTDLDATHMFGILRERRGVRWVATPHPSAYSVDANEGGKRKSAVVAANLIGHLVTHLELLKWGHIGWDDVTAPVRTRVVKDAATLKEFQRTIEDAPRVAIDTETKDLRRIGNQLLTVQMGVDGYTGWVLPVAHAGSPLDPQLLRIARGWLKRYLEESDTSTHVYANATFDIHQLTDWCRLRWYNHNIYDIVYGTFCFAPHTLVCTEAGDIRIDDLVRMVDPPRVLSFDHETNETEYRDVIGTSEHVTEKKMVLLEYDGGSVTVTEDHEVWSVTRQTYVEVRSLTESEEILILEQPPAQS